MEHTDNGHKNGRGNHEYSVAVDKQAQSVLPTLFAGSFIKSGYRLPK
jgi:hypothetical protein